MSKYSSFRGSKTTTEVATAATVTTAVAATTAAAATATNIIDEMIKSPAFCCSNLG